jgi:hypothetical protein
MTAKEQALKLYDKFFSNAESRNKIGLYDEDLHKYNAKQCASIAVDEIIKLDIFDCNDEWSDEEGDTREYWEEVKQEIEKL